MRPTFARRTGRVAFICFAGGLAFSGGGCPATDSGATPSDGATPGGNATTHEVVIKDFAFQPKELTIKKGDSVRWVNRETSLVLHTSTSGNPGDTDAGQLWDSGDVQPGVEFTRTFSDAGTFTYFCDHHETTMRDARVFVTP